MSTRSLIDIINDAFNYVLICYIQVFLKQDNCLKPHLIIIGTPKYKSII